MHLAKMCGSNRTLVYSAAVLCLAVAALLYGAEFSTTDASTANAAATRAVMVSPAAVFPANAGTLGPIPDNLPATPRDVTFTVSGITGAPSNVEVSMTYSPVHTWVGDINVFLIAPNGNSFVIYGRTGQVGAGAGAK